MDNVQLLMVAKRLHECADALMNLADEISMHTKVKLPEEKARAIEEAYGTDVKCLVSALADRGIAAEVAAVQTGPTVMRIKLSLPPGSKYNQVMELMDELQCDLQFTSLRIVAPIPGEAYIGIEIPRPEPENVTFADTVLPEIHNLDSGRKRFNLPIVYGVGVERRTIVDDLAEIPHLIVGGAVAQGDKWLLHSFLNGLISTRSPDEVRLIIADSMYVEYSSYEGLPHLLLPVITDHRKLVFALQWAVKEMEKRFKLFRMAKARNIVDFNSRNPSATYDMSCDGISRSNQPNDLPKVLPYIVIVIDDFADAMNNVGCDITDNIARLAAMARATGILLVVVTSRPDKNILIDTIKDNIPGRVAFRTANTSDSLTIIEESGAELLMSKGDCLVRKKDGVVCRVQAPEITDTEIGAIVAEAKQKYPDIGFVDNLEPSTKDLLDRAIEVIRLTERASTSHFQRRLGIGYSQAAALMDKLETDGYVGPPVGPHSRVINWEKIDRI